MEEKSVKHKVLIVCFIAALFFPCFSVFADTQDQLEQELKDIQLQIDQFTKELSHTQTQKKTLANKITQLNTKQKALNLQIKQTALKLNKITGQITVTESSIETNKLKQQVVEQGIAEMIRETNILNRNILVQLFSEKGLSEAFHKIQEYLGFTGNLNSLLQQKKDLAADLSVKQQNLSDQKSATDNLLKISTIQKEGVVETLTEQNTLLTTTKGLEKNYQAEIINKKKRVAEIRARIYELFNTGKQIDFGAAVDIAKWAGKLTGVRPALLLAILTQESNLGKNVGTCNRPNDPESKSWRTVMKPDRDQQPFLQITKALGLPTDITPVSCPMHDKNGKQMGWGGAMGPAQFIPSTWLGYQNKVIALSGKSYASPWDIRDAFLASAIKLKGDGANGTDTGDWSAAMRYFSGSTNLAYRFYGDNVLATAKKYQADIDAL